MKRIRPSLRSKCPFATRFSFSTSRLSSSPLGNEDNQKINFYSNSHILRYADMEAAPFSLRQLIFFGKVLGRQGSNDKEVDHNLMQGANFTRVQLAIRLARQIREFQSLPYIVTSNPYLTETYQMYVEAFESFRSYPEIRCRLDNQKWAQFLENLLNQHKVVIPKLAIGVAESRSHLTNSQVEQFMTRMLYSRISRRVLAEHHIALTRQFQEGSSSKQPSSQNIRYLGVIDTELEIGTVVQRCIELAQSTLNSHKLGGPSTQQPVTVLVRGEKDAKFAYIPDHLEFIVFELLLNAFRATVSSAVQRSLDLASLPIEVQIASSATHITIRISDQAGGILQSWRPSFSDDDDETLPPTVSRREMFSFVNMTTANDSLKQLVSSTDGTMEGKVREQVHQAHDQHHIPSSPSSSPSSTNTIGLEQIQEARLRIGLPLSSIYAQFFGGSLEMYSIPGFSDVVLCIPKLGTTTEPY